MKKTIKLLMVSLFIFFVMPINASAKTLDDMYKELTELKNKQATQEQKKKLTNQEMNNIKLKIEETNNGIAQTEKDIATAEENIKNSKVEIENKKNETNELLKFLQLSSGSNVYLEYLFAAESYTDFIYRYSIVSQLSEYNSNLMKELNELIDKLEKEKVTLANKTKELETQKSNLQTQLASLGSQLNSITDVSLDIADEIKAVQASITYYESISCGRYEDINNCSKVPYATSFKLPVYQGVVTSNFGWRYIFGSYNFHNGIDLSGFGEGTSVLAAADGVVGAMVYRSSCGGNAIYLHHNMNGTKYTTAYLHLLSFNVSVGDVVKQGQLIGTVGGGASTSWYDSCSTGAHLHFSLAKGWYLGTGYTGYATYTANQIDPREIFPFLPPEDGGWFYR